MTFFLLFVSSADLGDPIKRVDSLLRSFLFPPALSIMGEFAFGRVMRFDILSRFLLGDRQLQGDGLLCGFRAQLLFQLGKAQDGDVLSFEVTVQQGLTRDAGSKFALWPFLVPHSSAGTRLDPGAWGVLLSPSEV
jgi:hypothetical protein